MQGIMMIEPLYRQTLAGNKTMTRRDGGLDLVNKKPENWIKYQWHRRVGGGPLNQVFAHILHNGKELCKSRYATGEIVFIKEPHLFDPMNGTVSYRYDAMPEVADKIKWQNKMYMPAAYARVFLEITDIRCERLMEISDEDCIAEGIQVFYDGEGKEPPWYKEYSKDEYLKVIVNDPKKSFVSLYKLANKMSTNEEITNIWVWVYSYRLITDTDHIEQLKLSVKKK